MILRLLIGCWLVTCVGCGAASSVPTGPAGPTTRTVPLPPEVEYDPATAARLATPVGPKKP